MSTTSRRSRGREPPKVDTLKAAQFVIKRGRSWTDLLSGVARAGALGDSAGLSLPLPSGWEKPLLAALGQPDCPTDITQLLVLGEAALRSDSLKLAYAVSAVGLANGAADARFLFLRGRVLSPWQAQRQEG